MSRYAWFAAIFGAGGNFALLYQLSYGANDATALFAGSAASAKFGVTIIALTFLSVAGSALWMGRRTDVYRGDGLAMRAMFTMGHVDQKNVDTRLY